MLRRLNRIHAINCYNVINHQVVINYQVCGIDSHNITTRKETYEAIACYSKTKMFPPHPPWPNIQCRHLPLLMYVTILYSLNFG
jgi:hypothetical protein